MHRILPPEENRERLFLLVPFVLLLLSSVALVVAAFSAGSAASIVRYPDDTPVRAGVYAALPSAVFAAFALFQVSQRIRQRCRIQWMPFTVGLAAVVAGIALLLSYAVLVGDPEHYKGEFNIVTREWDPRIETSGQYLLLTVGVATLFPMGALAVVAKLLYINRIEPVGLARPEGLDPIGEIMATE